MLQYFRTRGRNVNGLEKLIEKFDCKIVNVKKMEEKQTVTLDEQIKEAKIWLSKEYPSNHFVGNYDRHFLALVTAHFGRRLYNQAINDAVNTAKNQSMVGISGKEVKTIIVNRIKKLER